MNRTWARVEAHKGTDGPTLGCDCYGGCWGDHSAEWSKLVFVSERDAAEAARLGHQNQDGSPLVGDAKEPYGTRVLVGRELRFSNFEAMEAFARRQDMNAVPMWPMKIRIPLSFAMLRAVNEKRGAEWHGPGGLRAWTVLEWAGALCGEAGELANVAKKMKRVEDDIRGRDDEKDREVLRRKLADEIADVAIYLDLIAAREGIDLGEAIARKFNATSEARGFPHRLPEP